MLRLAVLVSGGGSNLQFILDAWKAGSLNSVQPVLVVADRPCGGLERAGAAGVDSVLLDRRLLAGSLSDELHRILKKYRIDIAALAGWLSILDEKITGSWTGRIVNIHPSLLPKHGGMGMYGLRVHRSVLKSGEKESGCSVHLVTGGVDEGTVLGQRRIAVLPGDSPEILADRVLREEHVLYPEVLQRLGLEHGI
jgi:phosphoribosylglycinamide formyltransferase-1